MFGDQEEVMKTVRDQARQRGFSLIEILVAMLITLIVMASVFTLLQKGQSSFQREPEVADMQQNARYGLDMISHDLTAAGLNTPSATAIGWIDGGGDTPDEITIIYADPDIPTVTPLMCDPKGGGGGGPCKTVENSSTLFVKKEDFNPPMPDDASAEAAFHKGQVLFAIEYADCDVNGDDTKGNGALGIIPFEITTDPTTAGDKLNINHNPGAGKTDLNHPNGFDGEVTPGCSVIGVFRVVQYRINPLPPAANPVLERRDLSMIGEAGQWTPVGRNVENLQVEFAVGTNPAFDPDPALPLFDDPTTWITQVSVEIDAKSETTDLQGASQGDFADGNRLRRTYKTAVSLRNQQAAMSVADTDGDGKPDNYYQ
jgi:prepilin-type N-terminal cleavage/methylation domain-containing protein